jgi:hypothetical protein
MRFSDLAKSKLAEAKEQFGSYSYNDKGPDEVMDVDELVREIKRLPVEKALEELKHLAAREDCALDPTSLVSSILHSLDDDEKYDSLFEDEDLSEHY